MLINNNTVFIDGSVEPSIADFLLFHQVYNLNIMGERWTKYTEAFPRTRTEIWYGFCRCHQGIRKVIDDLEFEQKNIPEVHWFALRGMKCAMAAGELLFSA